MRGRLLILGAAALMTAAVVLVGGFTASPASAQSDPTGFCGPMPVGGSCSCTSTVVPNVVCLQPDGTSGSVIVTTCRLCPPPCSGLDCILQQCSIRTSVSCG